MLTKSEKLFELFCDSHAIPWWKVPVNAAPSPDYCISVEGKNVYFEIKQIAEDDNLVSKGVSTRIVGNHVRRKIAESRKQVQVGACLGAPSILLIYNNLDPIQLFGTEQHDFIAAMYGELTVILKGERIADSYCGRNSWLRDDRNTSFSAVGHLRDSKAGPVIRLYENAFARNSLTTTALPPCFEVVHVELTQNMA